MYKIPNLRAPIRGMLTGVMVLTMLTSPTVSGNEAEDMKAANQAVAMYAQGMPWEQFLAITRIQRETWLTNAGREVPPDLVNRFKRVGNDLQLLIITADWCPDSAHSVPYIAKLASDADVELRLLNFKDGKAILDAHRTADGRASTPTVILIRDNEEVAAWVEQPASLQWWYFDMADEISDEERMERKMSWYDWNRGSDALKEIVLLAEKTAKKAKTARRPQ